MKTAVIYARYSSDNQTEQSIEGQLRVCNDYAVKNDIVILNTYIDRAMTGTNDRRPDFQRMIADSAKKEWDYVLVYKLDRFSRDKYETAIHKKTLQDNGVRVISATEYLPDTPEAIIYETMLEGWAAYYSKELSQKVRRGMNESRLKGNFTGGHVIYGYKVENKKVVIDEEEAKVVKFIYEQYSMGVFVKDIMETLSEKGIYNRGKPFARNTIYKILNNEKYSGIYRHNDEVFDNIYPQLVPSELFDKVHFIEENNKYGKRSTEVKYLLKNKLICGYCGQPISAESGLGKNGEKARYYKCLTKKRGTSCQKAQVRKEVLEKIVLDNVKMFLTSTKLLDEVATYLLDLQEKRCGENENLKRLVKQKRQNDNSIKNIMEAIEMGGATQTTMIRLRELEAMNNDVEKQIRIEKAQSAFKLTKEEIINFYKKALDLEPEKLINLFVKNIVLTNDEMHISYFTPKSICPDDSQGLCFYKENVKIPSYTYNMRKIHWLNFCLTMKI